VVQVLGVVDGLKEQTHACAIQMYTNKDKEKGEQSRVSGD
jgi:hypothetical protein